MNLIFLDTETTGLNTDPYARLCQLAYKSKDTVMNELFKPPVAISVGAMSVHHITEAMVKDRPAFKDTEHYTNLKKLLEKKSSIVIAHNARFDLDMLKREDVAPHSYICSLIVAQNILTDKDKPTNFKLQTLRYSLGISEIDAKAHDAQGDVEVLEKVFEKLIEKATEKANAWAVAKNKPVWTREQIIARFVEMSMSNTEQVKVFTFGKHQGKALEAVIKEDRRYCEWLVNNAKDPNDRVIVSLRCLLNK